MHTVHLLRTVLSLAAATFLCGCPTVQTHHLAQPERVAAPGAYVHPASKISLPPSVAGFRRDAVLRYDAEGLDLSAAYNLVNSAHHIAATVYVYPAPSLISIGSPPEVVASARAHLTAGEFERRKQEIEHAHPGTVLIEQRDIVQTEGGQPYPGKLAVFESRDVFAGAQQTVRSRLYVFCYVDGKWAVEYRFTHPKGEEADREIQEFMQKWVWHGAGV